MVSNERHLKMPIGSELGAKAGIGHEYAAAQFHRITSDSKISFQVVYSFSRFHCKTWDANISFFQMGCQQ